MEQTVSFSDILEAADQLSLDEQQTLVDILSRRVAERGRRLIRQEIEEARQEFSEGRCDAASVEDIMKDVSS